MSSILHVKPEYRHIVWAPVAPCPLRHTIFGDRVTSRGYDHTTVGTEVSSILVIEDQLTGPSQSWSDAPEVLITKLRTPQIERNKCGLLLRDERQTLEVNGDSRARQLV